MLPLVPVVDEEHQILKQYTKLCSELNPKATGSIYDIDPEIYLDLYGEDLPTKVEKWVAD